MQDNLYRDVLTCGDVTQLAMTNGKCIGAIACRLQMLSDGSAKLYILTLGVLEAYRNKGIGASPSSLHSGAADAIRNA